MDQQRCIAGVLLLRGVVVVFNHFREFHWQPPDLGQDSAAFRVRETHAAVFHLLQGALAVYRFLQNLVKIFQEKNAVTRMPMLCRSPAR